jgi:lipopolysaccharide transport system ATP-binding protein
MASIISVENLSKKYIIGHQRKARYSSLREELVNDGKRILRGLTSPSRKARNDPLHEEFWALKDISFDIQPGNRVGIIGRNGAGKSTLLKLLSRITEPTTGRITINGRVASLLEVGTGFHPELTGRENIYLNGAILGMSKNDIKKNFDEIVTFADVEKFLDTPVKRYSSGMHMRLAFSVAAHLEPEILIVDEVLAVGDVQFQKKCMGKMDSVGAEGRTVLFVSHNMAAIERMCTSVVMLTNGEIARNSTDVQSVIKDYVSINGAEGSCCWENPQTPSFDNDYFKPLKMYFADENGKEIREMPIRNDKDTWIVIVGETRKLDPALYFGIGVFTDTETFLFGSTFFDGHPDVWPAICLGINTLTCKLPRHYFNEGVYKVELHGGLLHKEFYHYPGRNNPAICFEIQGGLSESPLWTEKRLGLLAPILEWSSDTSAHVPQNPAL